MSMQDQAPKKLKAKKRPFTVEEDTMILSLVHTHGCSSWIEIAKQMNGRSAKQCRERWNGHLNPNINKSRWTPDEDRIIATKQKELGNKWAEIAKYLPGRTDILVKNRWNTSIKYRIDKNSANYVFNTQKSEPAANEYDIDSWLSTLSNPKMRTDSIPPLIRVIH